MDNTDKHIGFSTNNIYNTSPSILKKKDLCINIPSPHKKPRPHPWP